MLLRLLSSHVQNQNWAAIVLEFLIVVFGVYVGLQVQDWSDEREDRRAEYAAVERLIVEYESNLQLLGDNAETSEKTIAATGQILGMMSSNPQVTDFDQALEQLLFESFNSAKLVPTLGTTNYLMSSGDLGLISDPQLRTMLTQWPGLAQDLIEWQAIERAQGEDLLLALTYDYISWPSVNPEVGIAADSAIEPLKSDVAGLFSSLQFEGLLYNRWMNTRFDLQAIRRLEAETQALIERLESRLLALQADGI